MKHRWNDQLDGSENETHYRQLEALYEMVIKEGNIGKWTQPNFKFNLSYSVTILAKR